MKRRSGKEKDDLEGIRIQEAEAAAVIRKDQVMKKEVPSAGDHPREDGEVIRATHHGGHLAVPHGLPR